MCKVVVGVEGVCSRVLEIRFELVQSQILLAVSSGHIDARNAGGAREGSHLSVVVGATPGARMAAGWYYANRAFATRASAAFWCSRSFLSGQLFGQAWSIVRVRLQERECSRGRRPWSRAATAARARLSLVIHFKFVGSWAQVGGGVLLSIYL